jgi:hypothetical protein
VGLRNVSGERSLTVEVSNEYDESAVSDAAGAALRSVAEATRIGKKDDPWLRAGQRLVNKQAAADDIAICVFD